MLQAKPESTALLKPYQNLYTNGILIPKWKGKTLKWVKRHLSLYLKKIIIIAVLREVLGSQKT